jgi:hypothetical protein
MQQPGTIVVKGHYADGTPAAGQSVYVQVPWPDTTDGRMLDAAGSYRQNVPPGTYMVSVYQYPKPELQQSVTVEAGQVKEVQFVLAGR